MITLCPIYTKALKLAISVDETKAVAIGKGCHTGYCDALTPYLLHLSNIFTESLWRIRREDVVPATIGEICRISTIESLFQVWFKVVCNMSLRSSSILVRISLNNFVKSPTVCGSNVLNVCHILQSAFNLERHCTSIGKPFNVVDLTQVL